ncbi:MAG: 1-acyl-sn-glycerol-3-phosphate acyltransferase [Candidatus Marinimicrobia bacterium]|nr:1-acyl-sn-glycerol-3-phosphate acyltransferase [Candidatus Neomarinimicrobiota bacterium]
MEIFTSIYRWVMGFAVFAIGGPLLMILTLFPGDGLHYRGARILSRAILWTLGARIRVEGTFPTDQTYILMANHASFIDPFIIAAVMKGKCTGVMAEESMKYPLWGALLRRLRVIPIRRRSRDSARSSIKVAEDRLQAGYNVVILPEGTRTLDGKLGLLKKGGFHLAVNTGSPILVIGIEGAFRFKRKTSWRLRPGPIIVRFGTAIQAEDYQRMSMAEVMEAVRGQLEVLSGETAPV